MYAKPAPPPGRSAIVCGRRYCKGTCGRWRHVVDFQVKTWVDLAKTKPRRYRQSCATCTRSEARVRERQRYQRNRAYKHLAHEQIQVHKALKAMSREDRYSYQLEGGVTLCASGSSSWSLATEDHDPTPVMDVRVNCPGCYMTGGTSCITCPDKEASAKARVVQRERRKQGLALA